MDSNIVSIKEGVITQADGTTVYNKQSVDGALTDYVKPKKSLDSKDLNQIKYECYKALGNIDALTNLPSGLSGKGVFFCHLTDNYIYQEIFNENQGYYRFFDPLIEWTNWKKLTTETDFIKGPKLFVATFSTRKDSGFYFAMINLPQIGYSYKTVKLNNIYMSGGEFPFPVSDFNISLFNNNVCIYTSKEVAGISCAFQITLT